MKALFVPDEEEVKAKYLKNLSLSNKVDFPYWTRVWPSALALSEFIDAHSEWVKDKRVLEIAGGLGLPSLIAAQYASEVCCSDYLSEIGSYIIASAKHHGFNNIRFQLINWHQLPPIIDADILLMSDVNYEPASFDALTNMIMQFLNAGKQIILTTPQRLMARKFIEPLLPFACLNETIGVTSMEGKIDIQLIILKL